MLKQAITTAAATWPVTLAQAKTHLNIVAANTDTDNDAEITEMIKAATEIYENAAWIDITSKTRTFYLDNWQSVIKLDRTPIQSVTTVKYYNTSNVLTEMTPNTDYQVDIHATQPEIIMENTPNLYDKINPIEIAVLCGHASMTTVPFGIVRGIKMLIGDLYENRQNTGSNLYSPGAISMKTMDLIGLYQKKRLV